MDGGTFLNFDLLLERAAAGFTARVIDSPVGQAAPHDFPLPFSPDELAELFDQFGRTSPDAPHTARSPSEIARDFGKLLFDAVFTGEIKIAYIRSSDKATDQKAGLRIRLRLNDVPELADAPWELLHDGQDFLLLSARRAIVRYPELPQPVTPLAASLPLRILAVSATPSDYDTLNVEREWQLLNTALADSSNPGLIEIVSLPHASLAALQLQLRQPFHILHFSGHGEYNASAQDDLKGTLVLEREDGRGQSVEGVALARLLSNQPTLRLVVLNACEGARSSPHNAFAGAAQTLIRQGVPAVLAMQFALRDELARVLASSFYGGLADGYAIDGALAEARKLMVAQTSSPEWAIPVLFMRAQDGQLFQVAALDDAKRRELNSARLDTLGRDALTQKDFERARQFSSRLLALDANDPRGRSLGEQAQRGQDVAKWYDEGKRAFDVGNYSEAMTSFQRVQTIQYNYLDVVSLKQRAARALQPQAGAADSTASSPDPNELQYKNIVKELLRGRIVPFLGQNVNIFGRAPSDDWRRVRGMPSGEELARYLASNFDYDLSDNTDLVRVSQYIAVMKGGYTELFEELHSVLTADQTPTPLHRFWAELPGVLRARGVLASPDDQPTSDPVTYPLVFTANYDDLMERAMRDANEPYDLLIYLAEGQDRGKFLHRTFEGVEKLVVSPSDYPDMRLDRRATIVKVHGAINPTQPERDSFVITEDHYLDYLKESIRDLLPQTVNMRIARSYGLFMGCNLRNWALRGVLYQLGRSDRHPWVVQPNARDVDIKYWNMLNVEFLNVPLEEFLTKLAARLTAAPTDNTTGSAIP